MNHEEYDSITELQFQIGNANREKGFRVDLDALDDDALRNYQIAKLALIMTEAAEAIEELRVGRAADYTYYTGGAGDFSGPCGEGERYDAEGRLRKPEGVPSEVADILIRCLDYADEFGFSLAYIVQEKLGYNATRPAKHGKKV